MPSGRVIVDAAESASFALCGARPSRGDQLQPLHGVQVVVLHDGARAVAISSELVARGANLLHLHTSGTQLPIDFSPAFLYDPADPFSRSGLLEALKGADVFVDSSTSGVGMAPKDVLKINERLIYSSVQADSSDAAAKRALADIACALNGREKTGAGRIV